MCSAYVQLHHAYVQLHHAHVQLHNAYDELIQPGAAAASIKGQAKRIRGYQTLL
jgi:hypothetical protein